MKCRFVYSSAPNARLSSRPPDAAFLNRCEPEDEIRAKQRRFESIKPVKEKAGCQKRILQ
jgi:hypothetical protein